MRHTTPLVLIFTASVLIASTAPAQDSERMSIAQRLSSLRLGWGGGDDDAKQSPRQAIEKTASSQRAGSSKSDDSGRGGFTSRLPRLNPSDLLPGDMFSGRSSERSTTAQLRSSKELSHTSTGSARARMMREMRSSSTTGAPAQRVAVRTTNPAPVVTKPAVSAAKSIPAPTPQASSSLTQGSTAQAGPTVLPRGTSRMGSAFSGSPSESRVSPPTQQRSMASRSPVISEAELRRELLGPLGFSGAGNSAGRADAETTRSVAADVASSMQNTAAAGGDSIEKLLESETAKPVATEVASQPEPAAASAGAKSPVEEFPDPTQDSFSVGGRYFAAPTPTPGKTPEQTVSDTSAATRPSIEGRAGQRGAAPADNFEQDIAKRRFSAPIEPAIQQSVEPRTAPLHNDADLLMSQRMPLIVSRVSGPKQIVIGREAAYRVTIANRGDETADQLLTSITVPEWAEVVGSNSSIGLVEPPKTEGGATTVLWRMAELRPGNTQQLDLKLVARQGQPIELGVNWKHAPIGSRTVVEVQEPKLHLSIDGPDDVLYGKPQRYRLNLSNPGTGIAEGVVVQIFPAGAAAKTPSSHTIGDLAANQSRTIEVELTADEAGQLTLRAAAVARGDLRQGAEKAIFCRKPGLEVDWRGPAEKFSGAPATYYFRVRNPGTATAEGVVFRAALPAGFEVTKASGGGKLDATGRQMVWSVGGLRPGDDYYMELQGVARQAGANEFKLLAADSDQLTTSSASASTEVIALADLKLEIRDPKGPVPVGQDIVYEVRVRNRGSNAAEQINIVGLFSEGIEPYRVEGAEFSIADGRVSIRTIDRLTMGSEMVLLIHARALKPGTHIFRAEVLCKDLDIKLAAEETTRFYAEEPLNLGEGPTRSAGAADRFSRPR